MGLRLGWFVIALSIPGVAFASPIGFQCDGTLTNFKATQGALDRELDLHGFYLEVGEDSVRVSGSTAFDATYAITARPPTGIGLRLDGDPDYTGFLNRFTGELSLYRKESGSIEPDGGFKILLLVQGSCHLAKALF